MWLTFCLSLALITALLVLPGTIALIAAGIPRWSSVACSPLVSVALYVIAGAITDTIGAHGSMPLLLCTAILSLAIAFPARALPEYHCGARTNLILLPSGGKFLFSFARG